jgi:hypothetical protein
MARLDLQSLLETLLGSGNVYFQPPPNFKMEFPCIVYHPDNMDTHFAGNVPYSLTQRYQVTVIDKNPDSLIPMKVARLPRCLYNRFFTAENLNHSVFNLYF